MELENGIKGLEKEAGRNGDGFRIGIGYIHVNIKLHWFIIIPNTFLIKLVSSILGDFF